MGRKKVYIEEITKEEIKMLEAGWKDGKSHAFRNRCQCILLSNKGNDVEELSKIFSVTKETIYEWLKAWKKDGIIGITTKSGQGRIPILSVTNEKHVKVVENAAKQAAEKGINMTEEIVNKLDLKDVFSKRTLRRFLKKKTMPTKDFVGYQKSR
jgi:transposase